jgi:hypothetical protein
MRQRALAGDDCPRVGHLHLLDASPRSTIVHGGIAQSGISAMTAEL